MKQRTRDKLMKNLALILSLGTLWLTMGNFTFATTEKSTFLEWDKLNSLTLDNTVQPTSTYEKWEINLTVKDYPTITDSIMGTDNSGGMKNGMFGWYEKRNVWV